MINKLIEFIFVVANLMTARAVLALRQDELQKIGNFTCDDVRQIFLAAAETLVKPTNFKGYSIFFVNSSMN